MRTHTYTIPDQCYEDAAYILVCYEDTHIVFKTKKKISRPRTARCSQLHLNLAKRMMKKIKNKKSQDHAPACACEVLPAPVDAPCDFFIFYIYIYII
jgi:hypothetical protein